ncbi:MAG: hypothetical protein AB7R40_23750 [Nitrospiraceae bacterium]
MKPICVPCQRFFRMKKGGRGFIEGKPKGSCRPLAGLAEPEMWEPYKLWFGDEWECHGCGATIIQGAGQSPVSEWFRDDFKTAVATHCPDKWQVNDC